MTIEVRVEPSEDGVPAVEYRWDVETDILTASILTLPAARESGATTVELEGQDGSWLSLAVEGGRVMGVAVAVWPEVRTRASLVPPAGATPGAVMLGAGVPGEVELAFTAESDEAEEVIYFRVGTSPVARAVQVGRDLLVDLDRQHRIAGLWLLNVPSFPSIPTVP